MLMKKTLSKYFIYEYGQLNRSKGDLTILLNNYPIKYYLGVLV